MRIKTHPITAVLTSAYLSAMLTSSLAPIRDNAIFAATVDPSAAQKALQNAVSGLDAAGWAAAVAATPAPVPPAPKSVPVDPTPKADPIISEELMTRLITRTLASKKPTTLSARLTQVLGISDGITDTPVKSVSEKLPEGKHMFIVPTQEGSRDVIIVYKRPDNTYGEYYLTDKTGVLRAAAIWDDTGIRLITNEQAAAKYKAELELFAKLAKDLPPAGTAVAGNS
ncbi:MAG: hypothetical protein HYX59_06320 [Elusimicrobia bacterium]|nr:hypothetical protein [Elusimicrobiota bacterium]